MPRRSFDAKQDRVGAAAAVASGSSTSNAAAALPLAKMSLMALAQLTAVAVPYQVYLLTGSSLDVGLVSLATVLPLIAGALLGGSLADAADRRKILLGAQLLTLLGSAGLAVNADTGPALWPLFALPAIAAGFAAAAQSGLHRRRADPGPPAVTPAGRWTVSRVVRLVLPTRSLSHYPVPPARYVAHERLATSLIHW